jgi:hypothetical protein
MSAAMEEQILDFLDGRLESYDEEELLHRLAVSPEKRGLLREHMKLRETITNVSRTEQLAVPTDVTASLYRKLAYNGYSGAALGSTVAVSRPMLTAAPMMKAATPVAATQGYRLSSLLTFAVLSFFLGVGFTSAVDTDQPAQLAATTTAAPTHLRSVAEAPVKTLANPTGERVAASRSITTWQAVPHAERKTDAEIDAMLGIEPQIAAVNNADIVVPVTISNVERNVEQPKAIDSRFFAEPVQSIDVRPEINDVTFDARNMNVNVGGTGATVKAVHASTPSAVTPEEIEAPKTPSTITRPEGEISPVEIRELSLISGYDLREVEPVKFTFGQYAKRPAATYLSLRTGGGRLPGSDRTFSGSLSELRLSYQVSQNFVLKASVGEFAPWENVAQSMGGNGFGATVIDVKPTLNFRYVVGAEAGFMFEPFSIPLEIAAGGLIDEMGTLYPRASLMTSINVNRDFSLLVGVEGILYYFDVDKSVQSQMSYFGGKNPAVVDGLPKRTLSGFIGPTIEAAWHF